MANLDARNYAFDQRLFNLYNPTPQPDSYWQSHYIWENYLGFAYTPDSLIGGAAQYRYWNFLGDTPAQMDGYGTVIDLLSVWTNPGALDFSALTDTSNPANDGIMLWRLTGGGRNIFDFKAAAATPDNADDVVFLANALVLSDTFNLSNQNDYARGYGGNDTMNGFAGNDTLIGDSGADVLSGGLGNDVFTYLSATDSFLASMDVITDYEFVDSIEFKGMAGLNSAGFTYTSSVENTVNQIALTAADNNVYYFNDGSAWYLYVKGAGTGVSFNQSLVKVNSADLSLVPYVVNVPYTTTASTYVLPPSVSSVSYVGTDLFSGFGNELNNLILGGPNNDLLKGAGGDDSLYGNAGHDTIYSGSGQNKLLGGDGEDNLYSEGEFDAVSGGLGNDTIYLQGNNAHAFGEGGNDVIFYSSGEQIVFGGDGVDTFRFADDGFGISSVRTILANHSIQISPLNAGSPIKRIFIAEVENFVGAQKASNSIAGDGLANNISGGDYDDLLKGAEGDDILYAGNGDDTVDGGLGEDVMWESPGNDLYVVDNVRDQVKGGLYFLGISADGIDTVESTVTYTLQDKTYIENIKLLGSISINATGNDVGNSITGNDGNNLLVGLNGSDIIKGGAGDDTIDGGLGKDLLIGGAGSDVFRFTSVDDSKVGPRNEFLKNADKISDFNLLEDRLEFVGMDGMKSVIITDGFFGAAGAGVDYIKSNAALYANTKVTFLAFNLAGSASFFVYVNGAGTGTNFDTALVECAFKLPGVASDGYLSNALVWIDANNNGVRDWVDSNANAVWDEGEGESWTLTDSQGRYSGLQGNGVLRVSANPEGTTVDISTGVKFNSYYEAPSGSSVISPLTTLLVGSSGNQELIRQAFGLDAGIDLTSYDPLAAAGAANGHNSQASATALHLQSVNAQLANILAVANSMMTATGANPSPVTFTNFIIQSLVTDMLAGPVDLSSATVINHAIANGALGILNGAQLDAYNTQAAIVSTRLSEINHRIQSVSESANTAVEDQQAVNASDLLQSVISAQIVAQKTLASQASAAISSHGSIPIEIAVENIGNLINNARADVGQVLAPGSSHHYDSLVTDIQAAGVTSDGNTLLLKFSTGGMVSLPIDSSDISFGGTSYTIQQILDSFSLRSVFTFYSKATTGYLLPDLFPGDASLGLMYQWVDTSSDAVIVGSNFGDFIVLQGSGNKAVNGSGGGDVIDGGTGSTFVSGGTGGNSDTFFLDGRAPGVSWSTITDFELGKDKATIWGWKAGISKASVLFNDTDTGGAAGYTGLTLHFENLLPDGAASNATNSEFNSITFSNLKLTDFGASSISELNNQIANNLNSHFVVGQTSDAYGEHGYLFIS